MGKGLRYEIEIKVSIDMIKEAFNKKRYLMARTPGTKEMIGEMLCVDDTLIQTWKH